ncbi:hypothetical protein L226DRAFT_5776 [Lentinus tigrinus ALCF2SS1-7]|uniref:uncharacterized protein n=1 Tax=Lentinus tigrinus ALCF2SS1-7 TaxID=1328758 RepID=UPI00116637E0|nr:hypothetical protein L226DRAFT_5776 [Lentinus tigrinus ALCF2SS1-7]
MSHTLSQSQDEFADLPDIVDFSIIRTEDDTRNYSRNLLDEFAEYDSYNEHDPYADLDFDTIPGLGGAPRSETGEHIRSETSDVEIHSQRLSNSSTQYSFDELDDAALHELNDIEMRDSRVQQINAPTPLALGDERTVSRTATIYHTESQPPSRSMKRKRSEVTSDVAASKKIKAKAKTIQDPHASARKLLSSMEESVSCPICYEIFSEPYVSSPCGHSFCAECVVDWMKKKIRSAPKCPLCRTLLTQGSLVVPNFALKDAIEKYVASLAESGFVEWQLQGQKYVEWTGRNGRWLMLAADLRDLQRRRWNELDEPSQDTTHLVGVQQILQEMGDFSDGDSSDDDPTASDEIYWEPTPPRR